MQKTLTEQFAEHVLDIQYETLPNAAIEVAKQVMLDGLAVTLARERLADPARETWAEYATFIKSEIAKWGKAVKALGAKAD